jgi:serine/threonine protein kinase
MTDYNPDETIKSIEDYNKLLKRQKDNLPKKQKDIVDKTVLNFFAANEDAPFTDVSTISMPDELSIFHEKVTKNDIPKNENPSRLEQYNKAQKESNIALTARNQLADDKGNFLHYDERMKFGRVPLEGLVIEEPLGKSGGMGNVFKARGRLSKMSEYTLKLISTGYKSWKQVLAEHDKKEAFMFIRRYREDALKEFYDTTSFYSDNGAKGKRNALAELRDIFENNGLYQGKETDEIELVVKVPKPEVVPKVEKRLEKEMYAHGWPARRIANTLLASRCAQAGVIAPYLMVEYKKGLNPKENRQLSIDDRLKIFGNAALALTEMENYGVSHRDFKPENMIVMPNDYFVYLIDLGLMGIVRDTVAGDSETELTKVGEFFGTLKYMSPEQAKQAEKTAERIVKNDADIWALGVLGYGMFASKSVHHPLGNKPGEGMIYENLKSDNPKLPSFPGLNSKLDDKVKARK